LQRGVTPEAVREAVAETTTYFLRRGPYSLAPIITDSYDVSSTICVPFRHTSAD
jgi:hypothetical protein